MRFRSRCCLLRYNALASRFAICDTVRALALPGGFAGAKYVDYRDSLLGREGLRPSNFVNAGRGRFDYIF